MPADAPRPSSVCDAMRSCHAPFPVVCVAAHPDDETIGAGALLAELRDVIMLHATDGAPRDGKDAAHAGASGREQYARMRRDESRAALGLAGIPLERQRTLGFVDQELSLDLPHVVERLASELAAIRPMFVLTHAFEGGHPDHDAVAFATHIACSWMRRAGLSAPTVVEMAGYHEWHGEVRRMHFVPNPNTEVETVMLTTDQTERKRQMFACYVTQREVLDPFPLDREQFRRAPPYDFTRPPPVDAVHYDRFDWGMSSSRWSVLARATLATLGIVMPR